MSKQAPEETPAARTAAPHSVCAMNEQGRDAELLSGSEHAARTTSPACTNALRFPPHPTHLQAPLLVATEPFPGSPASVGARKAGSLEIFSPKIFQGVL